VVDDLRQSAPWGYGSRRSPGRRGEIPDSNFKQRPRCATAFSRHVSHPSFTLDYPLKMQRAQGRPGDRCTRGPRARKIARRARDHRCGRHHSGLPCAMGYGLYALSSVNHPVCHRRPRDALPHHRELERQISGAPGPHDFAVRLCVVRRPTHPRPPQSRLTFVTTAKRPSASEAGCGKGGGDLPDGASGSSATD
jgi:hypothetical protein